MQHLFVLLGGLFVSCVFGAAEGHGPGIFAIRSIPFITLLLAVCFLNRYDRKKNEQRAGSSDGFSVTQTPHTITLMEEVEIQINCSWNINNTGLKVNWIKDNQRIHSDQKHRITEIYNNSSARLVIKHPDFNDSGVYTCQVIQDIPRLIIKRGGGTNVTYQRKRSNSSDESPLSSTAKTLSTASPNTQSGPMTGLVGSVSAVAVTLSICLCLSVWGMKHRCRQSERTVIREGPPSEGEEQEASEDRGSTATSRGSTQWYMVPVYESYFDLQRSDELKCADSDTSACASALN
ncbi:hypothetical protein C0J45_8798 [Silurus meridionalis]|nr:hypothetical protein C0J45_8798 [Silurus meridionalis]